MELQEVIDKYALLGYQFLMISDHDYLTSQEELNLSDSRGMVLIPGNEISQNGPHLLHVNARTSVKAAESNYRFVDDSLPKEWVPSNCAQTHALNYAARGFAVSSQPV